MGREKRTITNVEVTSITLFFRGGDFEQVKPLVVENTSEREKERIEV